MTTLKSPLSLIGQDVILEAADGQLASTVSDGFMSRDSDCIRKQHCLKQVRGMDATLPGERKTDGH